ncbi:MAG: hypothetical protein JXB24_01600 [Bacteroidales bacterium]|nr:hypothetical protein [Bacteroidales bacterium]
MKTKTTYPAKAFLVAGMILIQASLIANDGSDVNQNSNETENVDSEYTESPATLKAENDYYSIDEEAFEAEYEIQDWMCNPHNDFWNSDPIEDEPEIEEWMYNPQHNFWSDLNDAEELEPVIESWMTNPDDWNNTGDKFMHASL